MKCKSCKNLKGLKSNGPGNIIAPLATLLTTMRWLNNTSRTHKQKHTGLMHLANHIPVPHAIN